MHKYFPQAIASLVCIVAGLAALLAIHVELDASVDPKVGMVKGIKDWESRQKTGVSPEEIIRRNGQSIEDSIEP